MRSHDSGARDLGWLLLVGVVSVLLCLPFLRNIGWLGDEGILIHGAERSMRGHKLYLDTFAFLPPGGYVLTRLWFEVAGLSILSARVFAVATVAATACFTFLACREASRHAPTSAAIAIGWVMTSQGFWTQVSHHWLCALFVMIAAWMTLRADRAPEGDRTHALIAGAAIGMASMIMPTVGALTALAALTAFIGPRCAPALIGCALVPLALIAYEAEQGALAAAFDQAILFTGRRYAPIQSVPFGFGASDQNRPLLALYPLLALATVYFGVRDRGRAFHDRPFRTCVAFAVGGFVSCFPRPDVIHIAFAAPLACPLLALCARRIALPWTRAARYAAAVLILALFLPAAMGYRANVQTVRRGEKTSTPRGLAWLQNQPGLRDTITRIAATPAADRYLFYPYMPLLPFLTGRDHVAAYDLFVPGYTTGTQYREACIAAMRDADWVVIDRTWTDPAFLKWIFPAMRDAVPPEMIAFDTALDNGFDLTERNGTFELRQRSPAANVSLCAGIPG